VGASGPRQQFAPPAPPQGAKTDRLNFLTLSASRDRTPLEAFFVFSSFFRNDIF